MSEDEYSYSCVVYNKGDQEDSENMDPVSTCSNHYLTPKNAGDCGKSSSVMNCIPSFFIKTFQFFFC